MAKDKKTEFLALQFYELNGRNLSAVSRERGMPSLRTLQNWKKEGKPVEVTGGLDWDEYLDAKAAQYGSPFAADEGSSAEFERNIKDRFRQLFEFGFQKIINSGAGEIKPTDLVKLYEMYEKLKNDEAEKREFKENFVRMILTATRELVDDASWVRLQERLKAIQEEDN